MTKFVAEFTTNHMGNLNVLLRMVERAKWAGADFIKMQKKDVESYYTQQKLDAPFRSPYGQTYRDYRTLFEFNKEDFDRFDVKCKELNIPWFSTVQDEKSLRFMINYNLPKYKIASSSSRDYEFLKIVEDSVPYTSEIVISVGGSTLEEINKALEIFDEHKIHLLHCVAEYPCSMDRLRLGNINALKTLFESERIRIGYSGHEEGIFPSIMIKYMYNPSLLERHFCLSKYSFVHHIECSLEPKEFKKMVIESTDPRESINKIKELRAKVPKEAFRSYFGMSPTEKDFLVDQTYGQKYLGKVSKWTK